MALYGSKLLKEASIEAEDIQNVDLKPYVELMAYDDIRRCDSEQIHEFCASEAASVLLEKQVLNKPTLMRLSKSDDLKRRTTICVYNLAKEADDPSWKKMMFHREKFREEKAKLIKKYGNRAKKIAMGSQKEDVKVAKKAATTPADNAK